MLPPFRNAFVLTGPTGSGKSALALELAPRLNAEILALDSMTLYRGMDIGTAKPTAEERQRVPHHLIDVLDPWESASVAWWLTEAAACCREIEARDKRALFVGGTPLYLKAMRFGLFDGPPADAELRLRLEADAERFGAEALHGRLRQVDPATAERLHANDVRRVVRALEVHELTGRPISAWQQQWTEAPKETMENRVYWLDVPREELYRAIDARIVAMIAAGWLDEVRFLGQLHQPLSREAAQALGYRELAAHLRGEVGLPETIRHIQTRSRQFAKRQITWFRHLPGCQPVSRQLTGTLWKE